MEANGRGALRGAGRDGMGGARRDGMRALCSEGNLRRLRGSVRSGPAGRAYVRAPHAPVRASNGRSSLAREAGRNDSQRATAPIAAATARPMCEAADALRTARGARGSGI